MLPFIYWKMNWMQKTKTSNMVAFLLFCLSFFSRGIGSMHHSQYFILHSHIIFIWTHFSSLEAFACIATKLCALTSWKKSTWKVMQTFFFNFRLFSPLLLMKNRIKSTKTTRTQCSAQFTHHVNRSMEQDQWS